MFKYFHVNDVIRLVYEAGNIIAYMEDREKKEKALISSETDYAVRDMQRFMSLAIEGFHKTRPNNRTSVKAIEATSYNTVVELLISLPDVPESDYQMEKRLTELNAVLEFLKQKEINVKIKSRQWETCKKFLFKLGNKGLEKIDQLNCGEKVLCYEG